MTEELAHCIAALKKLMAELKFPEHPRSDWDGTNHYEITDGNHKPENSYWWLDDDDLSRFDAFAGDISRTEWGRKIGLLMDGACLVPDLLREIEALQEKADFMPEEPG